MANVSAGEYNNRYKASLSPNIAGFDLIANTDVPYSDIELYLMGLKSAEELRSAAFKLDIYTGGSVESSWSSDSPDGYFTATGIQSFTIDDIIARYGERNAGQKHFKAAIIALTDGSITPDYSRLVASLRWFAGGMNDNSNKNFPNAFNFAQATGGLGTIEIEGLRDDGGGSGDDGGSSGGGCNAGYGFAGLLLLAGFVTRKYYLIRLNSQK